ncbi:hypothetical protein L211DRAFT_207919 [Terfezia boudieri ATCC MYA-4762]|uniref:Uncharacterized protein n=1 Tax=Terfezia boudieri ATCC MYA-4762 TaxID=1051890 RepID=A0A3N4LRF7_9PEZI|nr:hypothetical protein L211DRAFT_207919 [Terfezia boudieri ATCC MYA-4762]
MIEPSLRTLPPLAPSRDSYGSNPARFYQHHHQSHQARSLPEERPKQDNMDKSGDCMVILPFSRSAFRGSQHAGPNKCECSSFFMSPGDPSACLCGHPASCHNPNPSGSESSSSNESSPYMPPISMFTQGYAEPMLSPPASVQYPSPPRSDSHSYHHQEDALTPVILTRLARLEKLLTSEIQARQILQENQKHIQLTQQRLSQHFRYLSEEIDLIITKSGESARETLDFEVLNQRQKKMADDIEGIQIALEGLDERTEDLEFRNDDLEKWVEEEKEGVRMASGRVGSERDEEVVSKASTQKEDGAPHSKRATLALTTTTTVSVMTDASTLPSPPPSSKRRRSPSDAAPPSYELSCSGAGTKSLAVANKRLRHTA